MKRRAPIQNTPPQIDFKAYMRGLTRSLHQLVADLEHLRAGSPEFDVRSQQQKAS